MMAQWRSITRATGVLPLIRRSAVAFALIMVVVLVATPFILPKLVWLGEYVRCGQQPVIASKFAAGYWYARPGDPHYDPGIFPILMPEYFCTQNEATAHGYHYAP